MAAGVEAGYILVAAAALAGSLPAAGDGGDEDTVIQAQQVR
jgi:hypothetical protein